MIKTTAKPEIQSAAIYRCRDKVTHEIFYLVKSDSQSTTYYEVRWNNHTLQWECNCPATKPCKHERAVNEILKIRRAATAEAMGPGAVEAVARMQADEDRKLAQLEAEADRRQHGALNGDGREFSLMR
jgi:hypothetical protein